MPKLWGTRFKKKPDPLAEAFTRSIDVDKRLAKYDVVGSIAHAKMLAHCNIISKPDGEKLVKGLSEILKSIESGKFKISPHAEDIHTAIQNDLAKRAGKVADRLHTARSRNDQVSLDMRLYCREEVKALIDLIGKLQKAILKFARDNIKIVMPGFTHMQHAQPVLLAHHMLAYVEMLERDKEGLKHDLKVVNILPLGSCALAGTSLPINRRYVAKLLDFSEIAENSMDAVSDRDFVLRILSSAAILGMHLSRIAEDLILFATSEFGFFVLDESFCTGSSIMPHKRNPDPLELIRGSSGRCYGNLVALLTIMKGLPMTYNRDMQLDKGPLFDSFDVVKEEVALLGKIFGNIEVNEEAVEAGLKDEELFSVDIVEYLINKGVSYREAHDAVGKLFKYCVDHKKSVRNLSVDELKKFSDKLEVDVKITFTSQRCVDHRKSKGGTSTQEVKKQISKWGIRLV
ncbi:MAG: argininosuccinate lyase [Candidatus Omnitrophica bacterium]|nr:argininosuccinate lyase [Candidatus Omnitrophota bacterium]